MGCAMCRRGKRTAQYFFSLLSGLLDGAETIVELAKLADSPFVCSVHTKVTTMEVTKRQLNSGSRPQRQAVVRGRWSLG